jgi:hypothetical protein
VKSEENQVHLTGDVAMSEHHAPFEDESGGEPPSQTGSPPRHERPLLSDEPIKVSDHSLLGRGLGIARSIPYSHDRARFALALLSLIFIFVVGLIVITLKTASFADFVFAGLVVVATLLLNLIFAFRRKAFLRQVREPEE